MIRISQIKLSIEQEPQALERKICQQLRIKREELKSWQIWRRSVDARKKPELFFVYTVDVEVKQEACVLRRLPKSCHKNIMSIKKEAYHIPKSGEKRLTHPPVIIGCGPAGLFCAWILAKAGYQPLVLERGAMAGKRKEQVDRFWRGEPLHTNSNVQFGEGGAGTFSDGKLNTQVKDPAGRNRKVLELFVQAGAPEQILYDQKPHLGTDLLIRIITTLREQIEAMGGTFRFESQVTDLFVEDGRICGIQINGEERIDTQVVIPAVGHSARDTFALFERKGIEMEAKSFAVGVRIEHPQQMINLSQYGKAQVEQLGAANYKLTCQLPNGRGVYSFCMCPGGYVVNASSEEGYLAVNGMSYHARDSKNANSAMIVTVTPEDCIKYGRAAEEGRTDPLAGVRFQRMLEKRAYDFHQGKIPVQTFQDFCAGKETKILGEVEPCMKGAWEFANLRELFPPVLGESLAQGIEICGKKIQGFHRPDALLSGVESRTSSPIRIPRNEEMMSNIEGIYPCGEGAGYAGGITSAAMDGLRVGEAVCKKYMNFL